MQSASWIVESRCAITSAVLPCMSTRMPSCTSASVSLSIALVASSSTSTSAPYASARANESSWRWPADRFVPRSRTSVA